jgi:AraC-like DNA-binding protein
MDGGNAAHRAGLAIAASCTWAPLGDLMVAEVAAGAGLRPTRSSDALPRPPSFFLYLQLDGEGVARQDGREAWLRDGDFTLCDGNRSYEIELQASGRMLAIAIPTARIRRYIACPESLAAVPIRAPAGVSALLSSFLRHFWSECGRPGEASPAAPITAAILELLGAAYSRVPRTSTERSARGTAHRIRIVTYIHAHLYDADLTPIKIARACGITTRYLHYLFSEGDETVARYILNRRLEACSQALLSGSQRGRTVTAIAFDHGFNSATHFGRVFRSHFGTTPREFRTRGLDAQRQPQRPTGGVAAAEL